MSITESALLDWQRIHDWAVKLPSGEPVGQSCTNDSCPLAHFLYAQTGFYWSVGPSIRRMGTGERLTKEPWIVSLIEEVDRSTGNASGPVDRETFLVLLEQVKP